MRHVLLASLLVLATPPAVAGPPAEALGPVAFLAGEHEGRGEHPWGPYDERLFGEWVNGGTALLIRSKSAIGGRTVFEDVRVVSYDDAGGKLRARQFAMGDAATYDVRVGKDGSVVWEERAREGKALGPWRYTFTPKADGSGFSYRVDQRNADGTWTKYVAGALQRRAPDVAEDGPSRTRVVRAKTPWATEFHVPAGDGPFPLVVFSPGGNAHTFQGYAGFGRRWASWGFLVAIVAFSDASAAERAPKYGQVLDWLAKQEEADLPWDRKTAVAAGHSRGGAAALLAAHRDERFDACVAVAPAAGPIADAKHHPPTLMVVGSKDRLLEACRELHGELRGPRLLVTIEGMDHLCGPVECGRRMLARTTAFLKARVDGETRFEAALTKSAEGVAVAQVLAK